MTTKIDNLAVARVADAGLREATVRDWNGPNAVRGRRDGEAYADPHPARSGDGATARPTGVLAKPQEQTFSPRRNVNTVAEMLLKTTGPAAALKRVAKELASARHARSRRRFQFWLAVATAVEARLNGTHT